MVTVGFEPTKHDALDLKSSPVDQAWVRYQYIHDGIRTRNLQIRSLTRYPIAPHGPMTRDTIPPELFKTTSLSPSAGFEPATYRLTAGRSAN